MIYCLDSSAVINGAMPLFENICISPLVISELEHIKTSNTTNENTKYAARQAVREIITSNNIHTPMLPQRRIDKLLKKYDFLSNINDHRILCEAVILGEEEQVTFVTSDYTQYLFAQELPVRAILYKPEPEEEEEKSEYCGWSKYYPNEEQMASLYSQPEINVLDARINEFCEIFEGDQLKDVLFWNGERYTNLKYSDFKNKFLNETIKPRNLEQKMAFHLLQNQDIKVKLLVSAWGSGKTILALNYALDQISKGNYGRLVFVRNNIIVADTNDIGYMPGGLRDKMSIWSEVIADHVGGQEMLEQLIDEGLVETFPLSHMRGRSLHSSIVICDECENLNDKLVTLLLSRIEEDSEIIFCGDIAQIDSKKFEKNNGIRALVSNLAGDPLFGMVKLIKSERGRVPRLCDRIRPPH